METPTARLALLKPDSLEFVDVDDHINDSMDKIDGSIGIQMVNDGADAVNIFDGAIIREKTSGKEYFYKSDGLGGFNKLVRSSGSLGTINHYNKQVSGSINSLSPSGNWQATSGTSPSAWTVDREAPALIRVLIEVTVGAVTAIYYRLSGQANSQSAAYYVTGGQKVGIYFTYFTTLSAGSYTPGLDVYNVVSANSVISTIAYYIDTNAVLT